MAVFKNGIFASYNGQIITPQSSGLSSNVIDPCLAFIQAAGIIDSQQRYAIYTLVSDLQLYGIWDKMQAIYPFVGGSANSHKFNLKNPLDTDAAFRLTFSGSWIHSSTGAKPDGSTAWGSTKYIPSVNSTENSFHMTYYSRTLVSETVFDFAARDNVGQTELAISRGGSTSVFDPNTFDNSTLTFSSNSQGFFLTSRTGSLGIFGQRNTTQQQGSQVEYRQNQAIYIATANYQNAPFGGYSTKEVAFASLGLGLTLTEAVNFYTAVQRFQTTLGRQV
jgi:hypothetical protein